MVVITDEVPLDAPIRPESKQICKMAVFMTPEQDPSNVMDCLVE